MTKTLTDLREAYREEARRLAEIDRAVELLRALMTMLVEAKKGRLG